MVNCFVSNVDYSVNLTRQKGFSDYYTTSQGGNLVTANRRNCNPNVVKRFNKMKTVQKNMIIPPLYFIQQKEKLLIHLIF